jgi:hypothetical protein
LVWRGKLRVLALSTYLTLAKSRVFKGGQVEQDKRWKSRIVTREGLGTGDREWPLNDG